MSFAQTLQDYGLTPDYFLHLAFLNEMGSITYLVVFSILFMLTGGFVVWFFAFCSALILSILLSRFIINRRAALVDNAATVITGCSSGIGREMAITFAAERGFVVFATVRKQADADSLLTQFKATPTPAPATPDQPQQKRGEIIPIILDVTDDASIKKGLETIEDVLSAKQLILISLVNNAGYAQPGHLEVLDEKRTNDQFNANVFGLINVTNHFLPLLRRSVCQLKTIGSRLTPSVLNIGSVASFASLSPLGVYCSSKGAVYALSETYRHELQGFGISVVTICPGAVKTGFYQTLSKNHLGAPTTVTTTKSTSAEYGARESISITESRIDLTSPIEPYVQEFYSAWGDAANSHMPIAEAAGFSPATVSGACYDAILSPRPHAFYPTGPDAVFLIPLLRYIASTGILDYAAVRASPNRYPQKAKLD